MAVIEFTVTPEEDGGYTASSRAGTHSLVTYGSSLDELHSMVVELLELYVQNSGETVEAYSLRFVQPVPAAA
jgi:hypothetical protein